MTDEKIEKDNAASGKAGSDLPRATSPRPVPDGADLTHPSLFFNRELSELDFNWRVLHQAMDKRIPLLERVRFVAITASNLDEFTQKRVGGLERQRDAGVSALSPDGRTPDEQLELIREALRDLLQRVGEVWETLRPALAEEAGIHVFNYTDLNEAQQQEAQTHFESVLFPILTPLAVDPGRPFPFISNLSLSLAVALRHPEQDAPVFARVKVPMQRGRWLRLEENTFVPVEQVIAHHVAKLFPGTEVLNAHALRVTRNAYLERDEEEADDLLAMISEELRERPFSEVVRLELDRAMPDEVQGFLRQKLELEPADVITLPGMLAHRDLTFFADLPKPEFKYSQYKYPEWRSVVPPALKEEETSKSIFEVLKHGDVLVHHPYEKFGVSVLRLLEEAADDPKVLAIKQTLYRTSADSPTVAALVRAAEKGKQVAVLVEIKARFDEENNIEWGAQLQDAGVHVAYGMVGLKTHAKALLIVREEAGKIRTYWHIGTGNYHSGTTSLYTDFGLLSADPEVGRDLIHLFHTLTGYAPEQSYDTLLVAPGQMRDAFSRLIDNEIKLQKNGGEGRIVAKMNGLDDVTLIAKLYEASRAGVQIDLIVRGLCRLRPGLPGYSETVRVVSLVGRFLEHDRTYYFNNGGDPKLFIGSADWRGRNLDDRVEAVTPVLEPALRTRLSNYLELALRDNRLAWELDSDGRYQQLQPEGDEEEVNLHKTLMERAKQTT